MSQESSDSLSLTPGKALGKRKSTPSSRYGEGSSYLDSEGWAGGRAASAGGSGRMSNPIGLDMSGSGLDVSGSSSVLLEGLVAGAHEGEDEVGEGDEEEADEESSDSGDSVKEVKTRGKAKSGKGWASDQGVDPFTIQRAMERPGEWECCFLAIGKQTPWGERSDALRPAMWLRVVDTFMEAQTLTTFRNGVRQDLHLDYQRNRDPVDKAKLADTIERGWNCRSNALEKEERGAAKLTGEGTMTQEEESELYARDSEAMAGDFAAKEQVAAAKAERDRAAYGGGAVSLLAGGGESPQAAAPPPAPPVAELLPQDGALLGGGRGRGSTAGGRGTSSGAGGAVGRTHVSARGGRPRTGAGAAHEYLARRGNSGGIDDEEELGEDPEDPRGEDEDFGGGGQGDYDDGDESSASGLGHAYDGSDGQGQVDLDDEEATELSAGKAGRMVRSGRGGGVRKQKFRGTPGVVSGGSSEMMDLMRVAVTKLVDRRNPQQQPPAPAEVDALRAQVADNTQLAQGSHEMAEQSLQ
ncbi:unnamed protein product [Ectocarpus sp. CCAP 1310/34]|nr:unnamed protein product [Ectocarpus sp. CCAP 1310/34]